MSNRTPSFDWSGLWLAVPAIAFLLLYMTAQEFTILDHAIAFIFVALLGYGTYALQQRQKRRRLRRAMARQRDSSSRDTRR